MTIQDLIAFASSDRFLADVTIAMTIALSVLHALRLVTSRIRPYVQRSPQTWDDAALAWIVALLDGLDAIVDAVSVVIPRPPARLNPTPASDAAGITSPETPSGLAGLLVFVNGAEVTAPRSTLTYEDVVEMAGLTGHPSVTFRRARDGRQGILHAGQAVDVVAGTALNAVHTGNA